MDLLKKRPRRVDPEFLDWAKRQGGVCCICRRLEGEHTPADELHHFGDKGMGQKSDDYIIARLCKKHHLQHQGKRAIAFDRAGEWEIAAALWRDAHDLLSDYVMHLKVGGR